MRVLVISHNDFECLISKIIVDLYYKRIVGWIRGSVSKYIEIIRSFDFYRYDIVYFIDIPVNEELIRYRFSGLGGLRRLFPDIDVEPLKKIEYLSNQVLP